jgi:hypothetical protein
MESANSIPASIAGSMPAMVRNELVTMKVAALVLGILGGVGGFVGAIFALVVGGLGAVFGAKGAGTVIGGGWAAIPLALIGIIGGALAMAKPTAAGILMLISGIGGFIAISAGYLFGGPLLIAGGILALVVRKSTGGVQRR